MTSSREPDRARAEDRAHVLPITIVVVTWNSADVLPSLLESIAASDPPPADLIVVDNASRDGSAGLVREWASRQGAVPTRVIPNTENLGFAAGANQGIESAAQPFACLVNPDIRLRTDTLSALSRALEGAPSDVAVVGGKLLRAVGDELATTDVIDSTGIVMTGDGRHLDRGAGTIDLRQFDHALEVFGITGALALFRRSSLMASKVDGEVFDEDFFAYREDADLAWRLQGFGYRALYVPSAVAYHRRSVTPERRRGLSPIINYHSVKNRFLLRLHHADRGWLVRFGLRSLFRDVLVIGACLTVERSSLPALAWVVHHRARHLARRRVILQRRTVPSAALRAWFGK